MRLSLPIRTTVCLVVALSAGSARAFDGDFHRWLGIGWGPGYHAYNNCGHCGDAGWSGVQGYSSGGYVQDFRPPARGPEPLPAARPMETPARPSLSPPPMQPQQSVPMPSPNFGPRLAPPLVKPSEEAARAGRFFAPSAQYSPTYVGQRYPRASY